MKMRSVVIWCYINEQNGLMYSHVTAKQRKINE